LSVIELLAQVAACIVIASVSALLFAVIFIGPKAR
jgi:hypothetical protein